MKIKMKIIASISIFILLFSLAWLWELQNKREFYEPADIADNDEVVEIVPLTVNNEIQKRRYEVFKAREYVRIEDL